MRKWLVGIFLLGFALRVIGIANHPAGFTPDEASFGYDAYSILKTGRDQWGSPLPLILKSFGDYKLPLYSYLDIPFVAVFGLNETAVRLPNAILGSLAIIVTYFLARELLKNEKIALLSAFLLAVSPWHIPLSRGAFEANLTTFFLPLGIWLFLKGLKNHKLLFLSFVVLFLNIFTYHTARILTPVIFLFLIYFYRKEIKSRLVYVSAIVLFLVAIVGVLSGGSRLSSSGIFSDYSGNNQYFSVRAGEPVLLAKVFNNKFVYIGETFLKNYLSYFSPQFLFTNGPNEGTYGMVPGMGVLYLGEVVFLIFALKKRNWLLIFWILISPIPAALTKGPGLAANRVAFMMPALQIFSAIGGVYLYEKLNKKIFLRVSVVAFVVLFALFLNNYFVKQTALYAKDMIYGAREVFSNVNDGVITKKISEPHIYAAFYRAMDPVMYQENSKNWSFESQGFQWVDQMSEYQLGNYKFSDNNNSSNTLIVVPPEQVPLFSCRSEVIKKIYYPNGEEAYYVRRNHAC